MQQGCPLGPLMFALVLLNLTDKLRVNFPRLKANIWYLDDGSLKLNLKEIPEVVELIVQEGLPLGLHLNLKKCEIWSPVIDRLDTSCLDRRIRVLGKVGCQILGSPIGNPEYIKKKVGELVDHVRRTLQLISILNSAHHQFVLAKWTLNVSKIMHSIRTVPSIYITEELRQFDNNWRIAFARWIGRQLTDSQFAQMGLPLHTGGLGIQSAVAIGEAGFISSAVSSLQLQMQMSLSDDYNPRPEVQIALDKLNNEYNSDFSLDQIVSQAKPQSFLNQYITEEKVKAFESSIGGKQKVKFYSTKMGGGVLFGAIPCKQFQTVLSNSQFITLAKLRLNMEVIRGGGKCECCGKLLDNLGLHCLPCTGKGWGMWNRLEAICNAMRRLAEIPAKSEKRGQRNGI